MDVDQYAEAWARLARVTASLGPNDYITIRHAANGEWILVVQDKLGFTCTQTDSLLECLLEGGFYDPA